MARYSEEILHAIRARIPPSQVCGKTVKLKRQGREYVGLSPFKAEKTPSFTVNDEKGFYHCFSSGKHGDIFRFLTETQGYSFPEAVEYLAGVAGVALPAKDEASAEQDRQRELRRKSLTAALQQAKQLYCSHLRRTSDVQVQKLLRQRNLSAQLIEYFELGHAPRERRWLTDQLLTAGYDETTIVDASLAVKEQDGTIRDRMINRLLFPIHDSRGRVVGFGGRRVGEGSAPKYLNTAATVLFHKGELLYNFHNARKGINLSDTLVVVEGYMDVIALHRAGYTHAVAPLGTAMTEQQIHLAWQICDEPVLCLDGDTAGRNAALRAMRMALPLLRPGKSLRFAFLPVDADPDDLVNADQTERLRAIIDNPMSLGDVAWASELEQTNPTTPERMAKFELAVAGLWRGIGDATVQRAYRDELNRRLRALRQQKWQAGQGAGWAGAAWDAGTGSGGAGRGNFGASMEYPRAGSAHAGANQPRGLPLPRRANPSELRESAIVLGLIEVPSRVLNDPEAYAALLISTPALSQLRDDVIHALVENPSMDSAALKECLEASGWREKLQQLAARIPSRVYPYVFTSECEAAASSGGVSGGDGGGSEPDYQAQFEEMCRRQRAPLERSQEMSRMREELRASPSEQQWQQFVEAARRQSGSEEP